MLTQTNYCMTRDNLRSELDALAYLTECTLATVSDLASKSKPPKGELRRQISIAQTGIDWVKLHAKPGMNCGNRRVQEIIDQDLTVDDWANAHRHS
jgi:hypothetical protein